jgi:hypothetical protein
MSKIQDPKIEYGAALYFDKNICCALTIIQAVLQRIVWPSKRIGGFSRAFAKKHAFYV